MTKGFLLVAYVFFFTIGLFQNCHDGRLESGDKINGVNYSGPPKKITQTQFATVKKINPSWISIIPFSYLSKKNSPILIMNPDWQWWGETKQGCIELIRYARKENLKVMLKPQIWVFDQTFTGKIEMSSENDWQTFENGYTKYLLQYASLADSLNIEMLCVGTELHLFVQKRPDYWSSLLKKIRKVYSGKLTYAENWDQYENCPFWSKLDYIGVDAYFPLSSEKEPVFEELIRAWKPYKNRLSTFSKKYKKKVLFTEYGYRSVDFAVKEPWNSSVTYPFNQQNQANAYKAIYDTFWKEEWFAGGFLWKWFPYSLKEKDRSFSPQGKIGIETVQHYYNKN